MMCCCWRQLILNSVCQAASTCFGRLFLVGAVVAEHGPEHVDASSGEGQDSLGVPFATGSFAVVVGVRGWAVLDAVQAEV